MFLYDDFISFLFEFLFSNILLLCAYCCVVVTFSSSLGFSEKRKKFIPQKHLRALFLFVFSFSFLAAEMEMFQYDECTTCMSYGYESPFHVSYLLFGDYLLVLD